MGNRYWTRDTDDNPFRVLLTIKGEDYEILFELLTTAIVLR